jgi:putative spermidine/putrescine transport system permease protein
VTPAPRVRGLGNPRDLLAMVPLLAFFTLLMLYPVGKLLWSSVAPAGGAFTLQNYARLFSSTVYLDVLLITFKISAWTTLFALVGGYPVAYLIATASPRVKGTLLFWVLLPFWTSFLVRTFAWIVLLGRTGALNQLLQAAGIVNAPADLLYNFSSTVVGMTHALMPLAILTMSSVMETIDSNVSRAALTLGARPSVAFLQVFLPLSGPGIAAAGMMVFVTALGFFITPALLGGRKETMIAQLIIEQVLELVNWAFAGAISVLLLAVSLLAFLLYDRIVGLSSLAGTYRAPVAGERPGRVRAAAVWALDLASRGMDRVERVVERVGRTLRGAAGRHAASTGHRLLVAVAAVLVLLFLSMPAFLMVPVSFTAGSTLQWPPQGFSFRWFASYAASAQWVTATLRSLYVGGLVGVLSMALGVPAAFALARGTLRGRTALLAVVLSPLIVPRMIFAVALFYLFSALRLTGSDAALVLGHSVVATPYVVVTVMAMLKNYDERLDLAATSLGARPWQTLAHVTLPLIRGGLVSAFLFAFVTSFDELTIALFVTGGLSTTLPKQFWDDATLAVSPRIAAVATVLFAFVAVVIAAAERLRRRAAVS